MGQAKSFVKSIRRSIGPRLLLLSCFGVTKTKPTYALLHLPSWSVLKGFGQVMRFDAVATVEVGDGAGKLEDAVEGAGAELQLRHRRLDKRLARFVQLAVLPYFRRSHVGVGLVQEAAVALRRERVLR